MRKFMAVTKALSDEHRVRMLLALRGRELCLCQIVELMGLATSTVSRHASILRQAKLVEGRKQGRWMHFRLAGPSASPAVQQALQWVEESLDADPQVVRNAQRLKEILKLGPRELCERMCPPKKGRTGSRRRARTGREVARSSVGRVGNSSGGSGE